MKKVINLKNLLFCAMLALSIALSTVSAQAAPLDNLGNTVDGSVLTNETEAFGNYQPAPAGGLGLCTAQTLVGRWLYGALFR